MLVPPPGTIKSKKINNISKIDTCRYRESAPAHLLQKPYARCYAVKYRNCDDEILAFYKRAIERLRVNTPGLSDKNRTAMAQFNDPKAVTRYVALPSPYGVRLSQ